jgi:phytoene desaturase
MLLTKRGYRIIIAEKENQVGGRNRSLRLGDYRFDIGPTFFLMKDILERIFSATGRKLSDSVSLNEVDPMYRLVFSDKTFHPSRHPEKMKAEMERLFPGSYEHYQRYLQKEKKKYERLIPCLEIPYSSFFNLLKPRFLSSLPYLDAHCSLYDVLGRYFKDDLLKLAFTFQAKYIGMSPWKAPGTFSIIPYIEHGGGIYHVQGGLNHLAKAMANAFEQDGGELRLSSPVKRIVIEKGVAKGVEYEDGTIEYADKVVINADFGYAMSELVEPQFRKKYSDEKLAAKDYSCSTFMLYLGVNTVYDTIPHHSILFANDYRQNVADIAENMTLSDDFSVYVQNPSLIDPHLAPKGKSSIYVLVPVPNNKSQIDWNKEKPLLREKVLDLLETKGGFEKIREHIEVEKIITPNDWKTSFNVYLGAVFNLGHQINQMLWFRPHNRFEEIKNCYLVGGGTHPGSGLPTIYESGRITADLILQDSR